MNKFAQGYGAGGLLTFALGGGCGDIDQLTLDMVKSVAVKYMSLEQIKEISRRCGAKPGDLLLVVAGKAKVVDKALGELRKEMGGRLGLADPNLLAFAFILNFPLFAWNEDNKNMGTGTSSVCRTDGKKISLFWKRNRARSVLIVMISSVMVMNWPAAVSVSIIPNCSGVSSGSSVTKMRKSRRNSAGSWMLLNMAHRPMVGSHPVLTVS